ncbi:MAG: hypothetical protein M0R46_06720 [Candidatus Muirbacterium halophilum]|nr:hypothetical protein [Candidatus Muirbacterium halophilum]
MPTYSINNGTNIETLRKQNIHSVLLDLPNNTQKLISPKDVRDAFLTAWAESAFKHTIGQGGVEYIGIDSGDPNNRDIKQKIYLGKRSYNGVDIMTNYLLNSDTDIFIGNTKPDNATQSTKISILAGTDSNLHINAPYIEAIGLTNSIQFNIINPSLYNSPINILSNNGRVSINGISFPSISETSTDATEGKILKYKGIYPNGTLKWEDLIINNAIIGSTDSITNMYGTVSLNDYLLEFIDDNIVPVTIGGIEQGMSFSEGSFNGQNWPLVEVLREVLYPYVAPDLYLSVTKNNDIYFQSGLTQTANFVANMTRYSNPIDSYEITGTTYSGSFIGSVGATFSLTFSQNIYNNNVTTVDFVLKADDTINSPIYSHFATASVSFVDPYFYGFTTSVITTGNDLGTFMNLANKLIRPKEDITINYNGSGYMYFIVPASHGTFSTIKDPNGYIITSAFTYSVPITPSGSTRNWRVYRTKELCNYSNGNFQFIF